VGVPRSRGLAPSVLPAGIDGSSCVSSLLTGVRGNGEWVLRRGELLDLVGHLQHAHGLGAIQPEAAAALEYHEAGLAQHLEVLGDACRGQPRRCGEVARGPCLPQAGLEDPAPLLVGQGSEQLVETGVVQRAISVSRLPAGSRTCALTTHPLSVGGISTLPPLAVAAATA
jgi:hypothetical protein